MTLHYRYSGVKEDGTHEIIADNFLSDNHAFIFAAKSADKLRCHSNPKHYIRLEIEDYSGQPIDKYIDHVWLKCGTEKE